MIILISVDSKHLWDRVPNFGIVLLKSFFSPAVGMPYFLQMRLQPPFGPLYDQQAPQLTDNSEPVNYLRTDKSVLSNRKTVCPVLAMILHCHSWGRWIQPPLGQWWPRTLIPRPWKNKFINTCTIMLYLSNQKLGINILIKLQYAYLMDYEISCTFFWQ